MRLELVRLSQEIAAIHREMFGRQASLRGALADLAAQPVGKRLPEQQEFMGRSAMEEAQLDRLREKLKILQDRRLEKITAFSRIRSAREILERLREKAILKHTMAMLKRDRKELNENSRLAFVREIIKRSIGTVG